MNLDNRVILITGAARRVGRVIATELAGRGARIAIHCNHSVDAARELRDELEGAGRAARIFPADLADFAQTSAIVERVVEAFGRLDVLINNASIFERTPLDELTEEDWDRHLDINLKAPFFLCRDAARAMRASATDPSPPDAINGKIVNIADAEIRSPWPGYLPYSISKASLVAMTRGLAKTLAPDILVNAIGPGTVLPPPDHSAEQAEQTRKAIPLKRFGSPADIASAVTFLLERGDYVTGAFFPIDGGYSSI